jgi:F-box protein 11
MTDDRSKALVPQAPTSLSPLSRLAERTLAERVEREERALIATRMLVVGPGGFATISEAVAAARDGDTVLVKPGRYEESVVVEGKTITIRGDGERDAIVVGWDEGPAFHLMDTNSTIAGLTIVGGDPESESEVGAALLVTGGAPQLDGMRVTRGRGIAFEAGASGAIEHSQIDGNSWGIRVGGGAFPRIEENEISGSARVGIEIGDAGTDPLVRANRVHDGAWLGILVGDGASPRIEENEIWASAGTGISIGGAGTNPLVRANRVHHGEGSGIVMYDGASPRIEENEISATAFGITVGGAGTDPLIRANKVHDGKGPASIGIHVWAGASPRIEENEIWANARTGIRIQGARTSPVIIGNIVRDGFDDGIWVLHGASPTIVGNTITGNALKAIRVEEDADPKIGRNVVSD